MNIIIPDKIKYVMSKLEDAGYQAYIVGGCVRDAVLGREPSDYDVATDARPEDIARVFEGDKVIDTGSKYGTMTVIHDSVHVEVTTFRCDTNYSDGRHPDYVRFSDSISDDLFRRDFTINAMAYNEKDGLVDEFGGMRDIERKRIRTVENAYRVFGEDALRILRAIRFSSSLGFEIEEKTKAAVFTEKESILTSVSPERIQKELEGILTGVNVENVLREYVAVLGVVIPEILPMVGFDQRTPYHIYDVWEHTIRVVAGMPADPVSRLAGLFHDIGKPPCFIQGEDGVGHFFGHPEMSCEIAADIMWRLKFDNKTRSDVLTLVKWHDLRPEESEKAVRKVIMKVTPELFDKWISIKRADNRAQAPMVADRQSGISEVERIGHELIASEGALSLKTLRINGQDIMSLGVTEGPDVGRIMSALLECVLEEEIPNDHDELMARAREIVVSSSAIHVKSDPLEDESLEKQPFVWENLT